MGVIEEAGRPLDSAKKIAKGVTSVVTTWLFLSALFILAFTIPTVELTTLGPHFKQNVVIAWALALLSGGLATAAMERHQGKETGSSDQWSFSRKQTIALSIMAVLVMLGSLLGVIVRKEVEERRNDDKAEEARHRFAVTSYLGKGPEFDMDAVNQTLGELEDGYHRLKDNWTLNEETDRIQVWLFRDVQDYQTRIGQKDRAGHVWCLPEYPPVIIIPLEEPPSASNADNPSRTPMHEMVHALMCQSLGAEAYHSIPKWFHEGMATRYQTEGLRRLDMRMVSRIATWWNRDELMSEEKFCTQDPQPVDGEERGLFYTTSLEFVKSLEAKSHINNLNQVVEDVRTGGTFEESMRRRIGGNCGELYGEWKASF